MIITELEDGSTELRNQNGKNLVYKYDINGNITSITENGTEVASYGYDVLQQITRENDAVAGKTVLYTYDKGGNILSQKVYGYTTVETSQVAATQTLIDEKTYTYEVNGWNDKLLTYNGQTITYDETGNPLQYRDGMNFTWTNGRSLKTVIKGDLTISYKYNQDNLRTSKTVNGVTTTYIWEDSTLIAEETSGIVT